MGTGREPDIIKENDSLASWQNISTNPKELVETPVVWAIEDPD